MTQFKKAIEDLHSHMSELEAAARVLPNQNLADVIALGSARLSQALEHPDIDSVDAAHDEAKAAEPMPTVDPKLVDEAKAAEPMPTVDPKPVDEVKAAEPFPIPGVPAPGA